MTDLVFTTESLRDAHRRKWGGSSEEVAVHRAPGRVVLRGGAAVVALDADCYVTRSRNAGGELRVISENQGEERRWPVSALPVVQPMGDWSDLVVGAAKELFRAGYGVEPANLRVHSGVPVGAGLGAESCGERVAEGEVLVPLRFKADSFLGTSRANGARKARRL
jgi:galactokinase